MTKQEEARRRAALADKAQREMKSDDSSLRTSFYAALFGAAQPAEESVSLSQAQ